MDNDKINFNELHDETNGGDEVLTAIQTAGEALVFFKTDYLADGPGDRAECAYYLKTLLNVCAKLLDGVVTK